MRELADLLTFNAQLTLMVVSERDALITAQTKVGLSVTAQTKVGLTVTAQTKAGLSVTAQTKVGLTVHSSRHVTAEATGGK